MGDEIKILKGRKYQKRGDQWFDIGPDDSSMEKILNGRKYVQKGGQWFDEGPAESEPEPVKKKDGGDLGQIGQKAESSDSTGPLPSAGKGLAAAGEVVDSGRGYENILNPSKSAAPKENSSPSKSQKIFDVLDVPFHDGVSISLESIYPGSKDRIKISSNYLPEGYEKTQQGARKYAEDVMSILKNSEEGSPEETAAYYELIKTNIFSQFDESRSAFTDADFSKLHQKIASVQNRYMIMPSEKTGLIQILKDERAKLSDEFSKLKYWKDDESGTPLVAQVKQAGGTIRGWDEKRKEKLKDIENRISDINFYIDKIGGSLTSEVKAADIDVNTIEGSTDSFLRTAIKSPGNQVKSVVERIGKGKMTDELATGLESLKYTDPERYGILKRRIDEGKTIASTVEVELTNKGAEIIRTRAAEKLYNEKIDLSQYQEIAQKSNSVASQTFLKHPDVVQKYVSDVIAKHYQGSNPVFGQWHISDNEIDKVPREEYIKAGLDPDSIQVREAIKNIKKNEGVLPFDNAVQKDSWAREAWRGFIQPVTGTVKFVPGLFDSSDEKRLQSELEAVNTSDYVSQRSDWFDKKYGMMADAFSGAGQYVSQYLLMEAGVGLFKGLGGVLGGTDKMRLLRMPESGAVRTVRAGGTKFGNYVIDRSEMMSRLAVPFVQSFDANMKDALSKTDNVWAARGAAFVNSAMESISEQMFDNLKFGREVVANFRGTATDKIAQIFSKGFTKETAGELRNAIKDGLFKSIDIVGKGAKDLINESVEEIPVAASNFITDALLNPSLVEDRELFTEMKDAFMAGLVSFSIPTLIGTGSRLRNQFSNKTSEKDALMIAAHNRSDVLDAIYNQLEDGYIDQEEANTKIQLLNTAASTLRDVPPVYATGRKMDQEDRAEYLSLSVKEKYLKEENSKLEEGDPILLANKINLLSIQEAKKDLFFKGSGVTKTPEEILLGEAAAKRLSGGYSELLAEKPEMAGDVLLEYAKQIYGVNHDGSDMQSSKFFNNENVEIAVTKKYPTRQSVIDAVNPPEIDLSDMSAMRQWEESQKRKALTEQEDLDNPAPSMKLRQNFVNEQRANGKEYSSREEFEKDFQKAHKGQLVDDELDFSEVVNGNKKAAWADDPDFEASSKMKTEAEQKGFTFEKIKDPVSGQDKLVMGKRKDIEKLKSTLSKDPDWLARNGGEEYHRAVGEFLGYSKEAVDNLVEKNRVPMAGITVGEMIGRPGSYKGKKGMFYVDEENEVIFKEEGKPKEYVLGMVDDVSDRPIDDFGIQHETSVVETDEEGSIIVRGQKYVNNYSDPMMAINETKKGYTVTLETADGKKRTFRGSIGEDIAYQIHLQQIAKNNEQEQFQAFVSSDPEAVESLQNGGYTEVAPQAAAQADAEVPAVEREVIEPKDEQARDEEAKIMEDAQLEQDAIDQEAEAEKVQAIKEATKPMISLPFAENSSLVGTGKNSLKNVNRQKKLEEKFGKLIDLIDCIYG